MAIKGVQYASDDAGKKTVRRPGNLMAVDQAQVFYYVREGERLSSCEYTLENTAFALDIREGMAIFSFKEPVPSLDEAERRTDEFLHSWVGDAQLQTGKVRLNYQLKGSSAPGHRNRAYFSTRFSVGGPVAESNARRQCPWRFHEFEDLPLVSSLIERYQDFRRGREKLAVLGYLCLSALEQVFDGKRGISHKCNVDEKVLSVLGRLVSTVGTYQSARKFSSSHDFRELSAQEEFWIESTLRQLIIRTGAVYQQRSLPSRLRMNDLPPVEIPSNRPLRRTRVSARR